MRPFLDSGNWVGVEWLKKEDTSCSPKLGELVLCRNREGTWVLHRVIGVPTLKEMCWVVKGDASLTAERFTSEELWGKVIAFRRHENGRAETWRCQFLDRWIARLSLGTVETGKYQAAICRRATRGLAWLRRLWH